MTIQLSPENLDAVTAGIVWTIILAYALFAVAGAVGTLFLLRAVMRVLSGDK
jgi:energy-converting hydrogenase Eha subunit E